MKNPSTILRIFKSKCLLAILITALLQIPKGGYSQYPGWIYFTAGNHLTYLAHEGNTIWAGDYGGLIAVDRTTGNQTCYNHANSGLPDNNVSAISIEPAGNKWIGTRERGLAEYDGVTWSCFNTSNSGLPLNSVSSIAIDAAGTKWIGTNGAGLAEFNGTSWVVYNTSNSGISSNSISAVFIDAAGVKWISTQSGISKFDGSAWTVYNTSNSGIPSNDVTFITEDQYGNKWISLRLSGVAKFNGISWILYTSANTGVPLDLTNMITIDQNDNKWIGTRYGLIRFDNITWTVFNESNSGIFSNEVRYILIDEIGNKWIAMGTDANGSASATEMGGLQKFTGAAWTMYNTSNSPYPDDLSQCVAIEDNGIKWFGTYQGLAKKEGNVWAIYNTSNSPIPSNDVMQIKIDNAGNKWIGFGQQGIGKFDNTSWTFYTTANSGLPSDYIKSIAVGMNNVVWIGTNTGLARFDGSNWVVYNTGNSGLPSNLITCIAVDTYDQIWITIEGFGVTKFDGSTWTQYNTSNSGLPSNFVRRVIVDRDNDVWIGTSQTGLCKFNGSVWVVYNTSNSGIPNNICGGALSADCTGNIWAGTLPAFNGGLTKFDGTTWITYSIVNSGLAGSPHDIAFDESGNKWIATWEGLAEFHEGGINSTIISGVSFTKITCNGSNNGTITISASGGTAPLQYSSDNGATWHLNGGLFTALPPNSYNILVKDADSIVSTYCDNPVLITQPTAIVISNVVSTNSTCNGAPNGEITINAYGGTGILTYSIDNGNSWQSNSGIYSGLSAGSYQVQVMDSAECITLYGNNPVIIMEPSAIAFGRVETTNVSTYGGSDGTIKITADGGVAPFLYSINNGTIWQDSAFFPGLFAGDYIVIIKDYNNCQGSYLQNP